MILNVLDRMSWSSRRHSWFVLWRFRVQISASRRTVPADVVFFSTSNWTRVAFFHALNIILSLDAVEQTIDSFIRKSTVQLKKLDSAVSR